MSSALPSRPFEVAGPRWLLIAIVVLAATGLARASAAAAALGQNGRIAFSTNREGDNEIYTMEADGSAETNVTNDFGQDYGPAFSPDGTRIAFERSGIGMFTMNAGGSGQTKIAYPAREPAYSPGGALLAYECRQDICTVSVDGSAETDLTNSALAEVSPAFSPDGQRIAFTRRIETVPPCDLGQTCDPVLQPEVFVMNADGTGQRNLTNNLSADYVPAFSPDGTKIAFTREVEADPQPPCPSGQTCALVFQAEIYLMSADDGSGLTRLTSDSAGDFEPAFSPDGTKIAFASDRDDPQSGNREIYTMNADGSGQTRLTSDPGDDSSPAWGTRVPLPPPAPALLPTAVPPAEMPPAAPSAFTDTDAHVTISRRAVRATRRRLVLVTLSNANAFEVHGVLSLSTVKRSLRLGARRFRLSAHHRTRVRVTLSRKQMRLLKRVRRRRVRATARVSDPAGHTRVVKAALTLKAPVTAPHHGRSAKLRAHPSLSRVRQ